jgi:hypothetical protein
VRRAEKLGFKSPSEAREDREGSGLEMGFIATSPEAEWGVGGGKRRKLVATRGDKPSYGQNACEQQVVVPQGTVGLTDALYDKLSELASRLRVKAPLATE